MKFFRNLAGVLLTNAVGVPLGLATSIVLARFLSTEDRGFYALAVGFAAIVTMLVQLGWPSVSIYRLRTRSSPPAEVAARAVVAVVLFSILGFAGALIGQSLLREYFLADLAPAVFLLALASVPLRLIENTFGGIARGIDRFRYENWFAFWLAVGTLAAAVGALVTGPGGLVVLMSALLVVHLVSAAGLLVSVLRVTGLSFRMDREEIGESVRFGGKAYAQTLAARMQDRVDIFVLAAMAVEPAQIAVYAIAKGVMRMINKVPKALGQAAYPQIAGLSNRDAADFTCATVRQSLLLLTPVVLILLPIAPIALPAVYGSDYSASVACFLILLPSAILKAIGLIIARYFMGTNRQLPPTAVRLLSLALNVGLSVVLIPQYGVRGAAMAVLCSGVFDVVLLGAVFLWISGARLRDLLLLSRSDFDPYRRQIGVVARKLGLADR